MRKILITLLILVLLGFAGWIIWKRFSPADNVESRHQILVERIEAMGKLELVKYRLSDVVEHKNISAYLPDASVLLIVKADAVGCVDLAQISANDVEVIGDSVIIQLPRPEICYVRIDHDESRVYDTKMAFFREAQLVDAAYKAAETQIRKEVRQSDILEQTKSNALHVFRPLLEGLGFRKINLSFAP
ncbi:MULTISPECIES: DUF4230 domain-containing protein [Sphingobacterium]|uniref:DUF4230 domain-containing protein n=1 Tax=Sphingobacterium populi TaxID=1812824 RepID=A0ABW5U9Z6_9SPHI|nr:DUF4230 domain-containing protein [Sphingobacterium sp. CFCC 11742]